MSLAADNQTQKDTQGFIIVPFTPKDDLWPLAEAWELAFSDPPNGPRYARDFVDQVLHHANYPNLHGYFARDQQTGVVLGVAYGYSNQPGQWWYDRVARALGQKLTSQFLANSYSLTELGVIPSARRRGVGLALVHTLLANQPHSCILLSTRSDNTKGLAFYHTTGWVTLLPTMSFGWNYPPYDILHYDLTT
jgi:ribosomal protein S18 acetylase RimI-like enzyme